MKPSRAATRRISRERRTLELMVGLYCRERHAGPPTLCPRCQELWAYAQRRLDLCVFAQEKPTCVACPIHCYSERMRAAVRDVMRFSGPRMLVRHPLLAIRHLLDERRPLSAKAEAIRARRRAANPSPAPAPA
ncbi:MAG TPA: nitrous oxide-stimulated promoter family protein [Thermoanaerobaculia bacterium]|nr:nitrous oxide-stimulated promoter family protein [Thermoanaerobaculia bacterium]